MNFDTVVCWKCVIGSCTPGRWCQEEGEKVTFTHSSQNARFRTKQKKKS